MHGSTRGGRVPNCVRPKAEPLRRGACFGCRPASRGEPGRVRRVVLVAAPREDLLGRSSVDQQQELVGGVGRSGMTKPDEFACKKPAHALTVLARDGVSRMGGVGQGQVGGEIATARGRRRRGRPSNDPLALPLRRWAQRLRSRREPHARRGGPDRGGPRLQQDRRRSPVGHRVGRGRVTGSRAGHGKGAPFHAWPPRRQRRRDRRSGGPRARGPGPRPRAGPGCRTRCRPEFSRPDGAARHLRTPGGTRRGPRGGRSRPGGGGGRDVRTVRVGERVAGTVFPSWQDGPFGIQHLPQLGGSLDGMLTELALIDETALVSVPEHLSFEEAATLPCAAVTAWNALTGDGDGARVIAPTSSPAKAQRLAELGADEVIDYNATPDWPSRVRELTHDQHADRVVDIAGLIEESLKAVKVAGHVACVGLLSEAAPPIDPLGALRLWCHRVRACCRQSGTVHGDEPAHRTEGHPSGDRPGLPVRHGPSRSTRPRRHSAITRQDPHAARWSSTTGLGADNRGLRLPRAKLRPRHRISGARHRPVVGPPDDVAPDGSGCREVARPLPFQGGRASFTCDNSRHPSGYVPHPHRLAFWNSIASVREPRASPAHHRQPRVCYGFRVAVFGTH